jgi:hypothetical protein
MQFLYSIEEVHEVVCMHLVEECLDYSGAIQADVVAKNCPQATLLGPADQTP